MTYIQEAIFIIVAMAILGLGITIYVEHNTIDDLNAQVSTLTTQKSACAATNENFKLQTAQQNDAIAKLQAAAVAREAVAAKAVAAAQVVSTKQSVAATSILNQKVDGDDCHGAQQVLSTYLKGHSK